MSSVPAVVAPDEKSVFLNVPFDRPYAPLFIALVAGLTALGRSPHCVLEIPEGNVRLDRILDLMARCGASVHDLCRVSLSRAGGYRVPRFNMPFELGLAYALRRQTAHRVFIFEAEPYRLQVSLSDLNGHDPHIHGCTQIGMLSRLVDCFDRPGGAPPLETLRRLTRRLSGTVQDLQRAHRQTTPFTAGIFRETVGAAAELARAEGLIAT